MAPVARHTFPSNMPSGTIVIEIVTALGAASPETISGFSAVVDGDTFVTDDGRKIRMIGINTPEKGRPFNKDATNFLKDLQKFLLNSRNF